MKQPQKNRIYFGIAGIALLVCASVYFLTRRPTPEAVAEAFLRSAFGENPNWSLNHVYEHELKVNGLQRGDLDRVVTEGLHPITKGFKLTSFTFDYYNDNQVIGTAIAEKDGKQYSVDCIVQLIAGRPTVGLGMIVPKLWTARYMSENSTGLTEQNYYLAVQQGARRDGDRLLTLGLKGSTATVTPDGSPGRVYTWEAMQERAQMQIEKLSN